MTQWLKATVALVEDQVSSTYAVAHNYLLLFLTSMDTRQAHGAYICMQVNYSYI